MASDPVMGHLLGVLVSHELKLPQVEARGAFDASDSGKTVKEWRREHLESETSLSTDEATLYAELRNNGTACQLPEDHDLSRLRPLLEQDLFDAHGALDSLTLAIEQQSTDLQAQYEALSAYHATSGRPQDLANRLAMQDQKKRLRAAQNIEIASGELLQSMSEDLDAVQLCLNNANNRLPNILQRAVVDDDRRLLMMELQVAALDTANHNEHNLGRIYELCAQLIACQTDEIRYRLNRLYLDSMHTFQDTVQVSSAAQKELEASLLSELDSLYTEIADVTQMYVNQEHLMPLIEHTTKYSAQRQKRAHSILDNVEGGLTRIVGKAESLATRYRNFDAHNTATNAVCRLYVNLLKRRQLPPSVQERGLLPFPLYEPTGTPTRLVNGSSGIEQSLQVPRASTDSERERLLNKLGVSSQIAGVYKLDESLDLVVDEAKNKTSEIAHSVQSSINTTLSSHISNTSSVQQLLLDALFADTAYQTIQMADKELNSRRASLESTVGRIGSCLANMSMDAVRHTSMERSAFVDRWITSTAVTSWTPIVVKNVTELGPQLSPDVTDVSRDGGYTALINGNIVWLYDDTECFDREGAQISFISNTAAYSSQPNENLSTVTDFGVVNAGKDKNGESKLAILADTTVGTGGWIPFQPDELEFNKQKNGQERVAIWPGTSPTSISTTQAFLYAPLIYVDSKPQDPSKEYQARGMTLIAITAPKSGPVATRQGDLIIPGTEVAYGGFSTLLGFKSTNVNQDSEAGDRDVYLLGMTNSGLQMARVGTNDLKVYSQYTFYDPETRTFTTTSPDPNLKDPKNIYLPGTFSSGSIFYSPYFSTFVMIYFNRMVDSTFYMRYLNLDNPLGADTTWVTGGKNGKGILPEDAEALVKYVWSSEQGLWASPTSKGGFNYAGIAHPEFFNRQYFAPSLYPDETSQKRRVNDWFGSSIISEKDAGGDGRNILLSWTGQLRGGLNSGIYQVQLAMLTFDDIPPNPAATASSSSYGATATSASSASSTKDGHGPVNTAMNMIEKGQGSSLSSFLGYGKHGVGRRSASRAREFLLLGMFGMAALG